MISIVVCDNDRSVLTHFQSLFEQYKKQCYHELHIQYFSTPEPLFSSKNKDVDLLFLDIQMNEYNGIDVARELREDNPRTTIIFCTNYLEYALQGYEVRAFRYLQKPITCDTFCEVMNVAVQEIDHNHKSTITLKCNYQTINFFLQDIMYCEKELGHLCIYTRDNTMYTSNTPIGEVESMIRSSLFFRCHKGCLVNLAYVERIYKNDVILRNQKCIPVSKYRIKEFMDAITQYWGDLLL